MSPIGKNKIKMRFVFYSKLISSIVNLEMSVLYCSQMISQGRLLQINILHIFFTKFYNNIVCFLICYMRLTKLNKIFFQIDKIYVVHSCPKSFLCYLFQAVSQVSYQLNLSSELKTKKNIDNKVCFIYIFWLVSSIRNFR